MERSEGKTCEPIEPMNQIESAMKGSNSRLLPGLGRAEEGAPFLYEIFPKPSSIWSSKQSAISSVGIRNQPIYCGPVLLVDFKSQ